jgi:hypothetical protein
MTAEDLTIAIMENRGAPGSVTLPNFYPEGWWECDVFEVTKSGYFYEFEVKLSVADFRRDATKTRAKTLTPAEKDEYWAAHAAYCRAPRDSKPPCPAWPNESKHSRLARGCPKGPSRFWFVVPESIEEAITKSLPSWSGLLVGRMSDRKFSRCYIQETVKAPRLHLKEHEPVNAMANAYHRYLTLYWREIHARRARLDNAQHLLLPDPRAP